jgi:membrane-associated phospholipid phosphatase
MTLTQQHSGRLPRRAGSTRVAVACLSIAVAGSLCVGALADAATEADGLAAVDPTVTKDFIGFRTVRLTDLARTVTFLGEVPVLAVLTVVAALLLWRATKRLRRPLLLLTAMAGATFLTFCLKLVVARHRPPAADMLGSIDTSYSFPSGHTLHSTVFLFTLAGLLWTSRARLTWRLGGAAIAVVLSAGIGATRIYLGYHWATDVLAGWLVAAVWLSLIVAGVHLARKLQWL